MNISLKEIIVVSFMLVFLSSCSSKNDDTSKPAGNPSTNVGGSGGQPPTTNQPPTTTQPSEPYQPSQPSAVDIPLVIPVREVPNKAVKIYRIDKKSKLTLLFSENKLADGGINPHSDELEDNKFYLFDVSNKTKPDGLPLKGSGNKRLLAKGIDIKQKGIIKPTALSEILYIYAHSAMLYDLEHLEQKINFYAQSLVNKDIDGDSKITNNDVLNFNEINDKDKLSPRLANNYFTQVNQKIEKNDLSYLNDIFKTKLGKILYDPRTYFSIIKVSEDETTVQLFSSLNTMQVDISDSSNIKVVKTADTNSLTPLSQPNKAYIANSNGVKIYDTSNLNNMVLLHDIPVYAREATVKMSQDNSKVFILVQRAGQEKTGFIIYDLNTNKVLNNELNHFSGSSFVLTENEKKCFIASLSYSNKVISLDLSNLSKPKLLATSKASGQRHSFLELSKDGNTLYLAIKRRGLVILDVSKSDNLMQLSEIRNISLKKVTLSKNGKTLLATGEDGIIYYYNVSNPRKPVLLRTFDTYSSDIYFSKDNATVFNSIIALSPQLEILDITTPKNPNILSSLKVTGSAIYDVALKKDIMYVTDGSSGLQVLNLSSPTKPQLIASLLTSGVANSIVLSKNKKNAFISNGDGGLLALDISSDFKPKILSKLPTNGIAKHTILSTDGQLAYVANGEAGLVIVDISNTSSPQIISNLETGGDAQKVTLSADGKTAFVANGEGEKSLVIIDVSTVANPFIISQVNSGGIVKDIVLSSDQKKAFISNGVKGVSILDVSTLASPSILATIDTKGIANGLAISKDRTKIFVANGVGRDGYYNRPLHLSQSGLAIIDVTSPLTPKFLMKIENTGDMQRVSLTNDESKAIVVDKYKGVQLLNIETLGEKL